MVHPRCVYITSLMKCRRQSHIVYATVSYISLELFRRINFRFSPCIII